ncbi:hypothetical protein RYA05_05625 [Pseudomonas syringae pv. actinidiae]|nr:hypothetical protein [Pseudomonas syringae pv. actinidiae]
MITYLKFAMGVIGTPLLNILRPNATGTGNKKIFIASSAFYLFLLTACAAIVARFISQDSSTSDITGQALTVGSIMFPMVILVIGLLLHLNKPAEAKEYRLLMMLALPWQPIASFVFMMIFFNGLGIFYLTASGSGDVTTAAFEETSKIVLFFSTIISMNIFWSGLKSIRNTSKFRNVGDVIIIGCLMAAPLLIKMISQ